MFNNDLEKNKNLVHNNQYNNGNEKHSGGNQEQNNCDTAKTIYPRQNVEWTK